MKSVFFPDEEITADDLKYVCYMIELTARTIKQPNRYVVNKMGRRAIAEKLSVANVLHASPSRDVCNDWITTYHLEQGTFDVAAVDPELCEKIPTALQMGKVYKRLIADTLQRDEDYAQGIMRVYNNPICEKLDDYNCSAYYEPSPYIARSYYAGGF